MIHRTQMILMRMILVKNPKRAIRRYPIMKIKKEERIKRPNENQKVKPRRKKGKRTKRLQVG